MTSRYQLPQAIKLLALAVWLGGVGLTAAPPATYVVDEQLGRQWPDELLHFDLPEGVPSTVGLTDADGRPMPCQLESITAPDGTTSRRLWTVVTLEPGAHLELELQENAEPVTTDLQVVEPSPTEDPYIVLRNSRVEARLPVYIGGAQRPIPLSEMPGPLAAIRADQNGDWLGEGRWVDGDGSLEVGEARTEILERGPVRARVRQTLQLTDGRQYSMLIELAARQDAVQITEDSTVHAPDAAFVVDLTPGLEANRGMWPHHRFQRNHGIRVHDIDLAKNGKLVPLRPWSFWWSQEPMTTYAAFLGKTDSPAFGLALIKPSQWLPGGPHGFVGTEVQGEVADGKVQVRFPLFAKDERKGSEAAAHMRRLWLLTVGSTESFTPPKSDNTRRRPTHALRRLIVKHGEFPLDQVKDYAFDYTPADPEREHPFLLTTQADVERSRKLAPTHPPAAEKLKFHARLAPKGTHLPHRLWTFMLSPNPKWGRMLAEGVVAGADESIKMLLESSSYTSVGQMGPWPTTDWTRLLVAHDLISGKGLLTPEQEARTQATMVFLAHVLDHPDYWNRAHGLASGNPNMTNSIRLPKGLFGLYVWGHPKSAQWLEAAEEEVKREIETWVKPGGAWIECPGYMNPSLDGILPLAQAIRNVTGRDYFDQPNLKSTMEWRGMIMTAPDARFPRGKQFRSIPPMASPSLGDTPLMALEFFPGWYARALAESDPEYSARQQFYWQSKDFSWWRGGRSESLQFALTDMDLPATPPSVLSGGYPGFGAVARGSWTDPKTAYVCHRTGPLYHHYHDDFSTILFYAKGAPLCLDFGNQYQPLRRAEAWWHNRVSFNTGDTPRQMGTSAGELVDYRPLDGTINYSHGRIASGAGPSSDRHVLLILSDDAMGANYLVVRDTLEGDAKQPFFWNLFCIADQPEVLLDTVHFPGRYGVDLDVHLLSPINPEIETDYWEYRIKRPYLGTIGTGQHGIRIKQTGPDTDYFAVLYPRAADQEAAGTVALADGSGLRLKHMEGTDWMLVSPGNPAHLADGTTKLAGELAFARRYDDGRLRLAAIKGDHSSVTLDDWGLASDGTTAIEVNGNTVKGISSGTAHTVQVTVPAEIAGTVKAVTVDDKPVEVALKDGIFMIPLPEGRHTFRLAQ